MEVTGGAIRVDKSWWYLLDYAWHRGKWVCTDVTGDLDLLATGPNGERISLRRLRCHEAAEMLGIWLAPDGNTSKCISVLKKKAIDWGLKVRLGNPSPVEAWTAIHTNISARLKYPLPALTLSEKECKSIMYPALKAALLKSGTVPLVHLVVVSYHYFITWGPLGRHV